MPNTLPDGRDKRFKRYCFRPSVGTSIVVGLLALCLSQGRTAGVEPAGPTLADVLLNELPDAARIKGSARCIQIFKTTPGAIDEHPLAPLAVVSREGESFIRNRECWAPVDLTPISACQFDSNLHRRMWTARLGWTLISPRHVLCAKHDGLGTTAVIFVSRTNMEVRRKVVDVEPVGPAPADDDRRAVEADFVIGLLDQPIDEQESGVSFARIMPLDRVPALRHGVVAPFIPVMHTNQDREVCVLDWIAAGRPRFERDLFFAPPSELELSRFYKSVRPGDSGSPLFTAIDGQFILLSVFHTASQGSSVSAFRIEIESAMRNLDQRNGREGEVRLTEAKRVDHSRSAQVLPQKK